MDPKLVQSALIGEAVSPEDYPQAGRVRMKLPAPIGLLGTGLGDPEPYLMTQMSADRVFMMGDNPSLPRMPAEPTLLDFFRHRFNDFTIKHLLTSAKRALQDGMDEAIVLACLLHDISNGCFMRSDHGYWGAQMIAPYVSEEIAWAVKHHQSLRYFADETVGYEYPAAYLSFFGPDYVPPAYIQRDAAQARAHRWYMSARQITIYDIYVFDSEDGIDPDMFADIIGRHFKQPSQGLGQDNSPAAHMWRTMIWPNNFL